MQKRLAYLLFISLHFVLSVFFLRRIFVTIRAFSRKFISRFTYPCCYSPFFLAQICTFKLIAYLVCVIKSLRNVTAIYYHTRWVMQFERVISLSRLMIGKSGREKKKKLNALMMPNFLQHYFFCKLKLHDSSCTHVDEGQKRLSCL